MDFQQRLTLAIHQMTCGSRMDHEAGHGWGKPYYGEDEDIARYLIENGIVVDPSRDEVEVGGDVDP